jgi:methylthioribulose-1-phosphate dehydratase
MTALDAAAEKIGAVGRQLYERGWAPATAGNYSCRLNADQIAITVSGRSKGNLTAEDVMLVDPMGQPLSPGKRSSAETLLHTAIYRVRPDAQVILHTHSVNATVWSRRVRGDTWQVQGYEIQKAFPGMTSHEETMSIPIFDNTQDIPSLAAATLDYLDAHRDTPGYLIRGHGLYTWGGDVEEALKHVEAFEFLLACELEMTRRM